MTYKNFENWYRKAGVNVYTSVDSGGNSYVTERLSDSTQSVVQGLSYRGPRPNVRPMPIHDYHINVQSISLSHSSRYNYSWGGYITDEGPALARGSRFGFNFHNPPSFDSVYNRALDEFIDKYRGNLDISVDIAEAGKTAKMLKLTDQVVEFTRLRSRKYGQLLFLGNNWLAYTYGIKPLLGSIFGLADESVRTVINKVNRYSGRANDRFKGGKASFDTVASGAVLDVIGDFKVSCTIGGLVASPEIDPGRISSLNPVSIAWELLPYSFVVDWFYNIGGYLRSFETALAYDSQWRGGYVTKLFSGSGRIWTVDKGSNSYSNWNSIWSGNLRNVDLDRRPLSSFPRPELPSFEARLGSSRLISAAALLAQYLPDDSRIRRRM